MSTPLESSETRRWRVIFYDDTGRVVDQRDVLHGRKMTRQEAQDECAGLLAWIAGAERFAIEPKLTDPLRDVIEES